MIHRLYHPQLFPEKNSTKKDNSTYRHESEQKFGRCFESCHESTCKTYRPRGYDPRATTIGGFIGRRV